MSVCAMHQIPASGRLADDETRFRAVFLRHYPTVLSALKRMTQSDAEAEDLAQEAFLSLGWHRFTQGKAHNLRAWLLRTATNRALNARRGRQRRAGREAAIGPQLVGTPSPGADHLDARRRVCAVLHQIDTRASQLLVLRAVGLGYAELAEVVGVAPGSIGTLLVRAQREFAQAYHRHHGFSVEEETQ